MGLFASASGAQRGGESRSPGEATSPAQQNTVSEMNSPQAEGGGCRSTLSNEAAHPSVPSSDPRKHQAACWPCLEGPSRERQDLLTD